MSNKLTKNMQWLIVAHPQWWLGLMLLTLHAALAWGIGQWWSQALMLTHFGLFLLWQPLWRGERDLSPAYAVLVILGGILLLLNSWWLLILWVAVLIGLVGGNMPGSDAPLRQRMVYLLALTYLFSLLLLWIVPNLLTRQEGFSALSLVVRYGLLALPLLIMPMKVEMRQPEISNAVDFFSSLMLFLLVTVLVLGSFTVMMFTQDIYPMALAKTLLVIAGVLLLLSWLWSPLGGFAGFGQLLSRYLLSVGLPFEGWLRNLASYAERESDPAGFLSQALEGISQLPWVVGGKWQTKDSNGHFGTDSRHSAKFTFHDFSLVLYSRWRISPALMLHVKLLTQLLGYFYEAKLREQTLKQNAYTQAIYETGARLTHDVKNLLQSLKSLCAAAETSDASQSDALQALMQRQLPQITQRLQGTLEKLQAPKQKAESGKASATIWWENLQHRYANGQVDFLASEIDPAVNLPNELFDSVVDNFLQNALEKRKLQNSLKITVTLSCNHGIALSVCDDGAAMPKQEAKRLFSGPVKSEWGLGIGLYQAARQAEQSGYRLELAENQDRQVCFVLQSEALSEN